jgi:hypothetical protein
MMSSLKMNRKTIVLFLVGTVLLITSCTKNTENPATIHASKYSADVLDKWISLQLRLMRNATGVPNHGFARHYAYSGVAAYESIAPGITGNNKQWSEKWNGLTGLPVAEPAKNYYYPANVNAAMAAINRSFFPNASAADKAAIDSLENALNQEFLQSEPLSVITRSAQFGKDVATAVFNWAETDGYKNANAAYTPPVGAGLWKPTPTAFGPAATPYWGNNRTIITGSIAQTGTPAPAAYSTDPNSSFYQMADQVYLASRTLTDDQKAMGLFWRDIPGVSSPGHWLSILHQVIKKDESRLDKAAVAYALTGIAINDALITCFKSKYQHNLLRPVTYIREVMEYGTWNSFIGTPAHPEYPSAHSSLSAAAADIMTEIFGNSGSFTDHTYDYMGFLPRTYTSYAAIAEEAGASRFYAGIHFWPSIQAGLTQGQKVAANILK